MRNLTALVSGIIFAIGLALSGMTDPQKVIGFLDIFGQWDYALAFVMGGAVITNILLFTFILKKKPLFCTTHHLPTNKVIDKKLLIGSGLFGIGWGLVGICPGPGIVNLVTLDGKVFVFMASVIFGMFIFKRIGKNL
jgi:uncharacterized membrane protein YedE/YeeE